MMLLAPAILAAAPALLAQMETPPGMVLIDGGRTEVGNDRKVIEEMLETNPRTRYASRARRPRARSPSAELTAGSPLALLLMLPQLVPRPVAAAALLILMGGTRRLLQPLFRSLLRPPPWGVTFLP